MSYAVLSSHKVVALVSAVVATLALQGGLLAGFDHVSEAPQLQAAASCRVITLPSVEIVHARS